MHAALHPSYGAASSVTMVTWWPAGGGAFLQQHCHQRGPGLEGTLVTARCMPACRGTRGSVYENDTVACGRTAEGMMGGGEVAAPTLVGCTWMVAWVGHVSPFFTKGPRLAGGGSHLASFKPLLGLYLYDLGQVL